MKLDFRRGLTVVEVLMLVAVVAVLLALLLPALSTSHPHPRWSACLNNLKQVALATMIYSQDNETGPPWTVPSAKGGTLEYRDSGEVWRHFQAMSNEMVTPKLLHCRGDTNRPLAQSWTNLANEHISYFINVAATNLGGGGPSAGTLVFGDRRLSMTSATARALVRVDRSSSVSWQAGLHEGRGCLAFADGSVSTYTSAQLQNFFRTNSANPALLALP